MNDINPGPIKSDVDLRDMVRRHMIRRSLACMAEASRRRARMLSEKKIEDYRTTIRKAVAGFYGALPAGKSGWPVAVKKVSAFDKPGYRIENVLFDSFRGWEVNATVYVPTDFTPPFPAVIVPVGHSGKQFENYQLPGQFFARCGYLAVLFDPPGQSSEKKPGNDHFRDGVRCYLTGQSSSRYFVADALRCIDYVESRGDADIRGGVAMTGVSGGGTTTTLAGLLDERISVLGPSCCVTRLADLDITQCYAGCPETHMWRRYAEGIDEVDLMCAAVPKPTLLMAGKLDEVFHIEDTIKLASEVEAFYTAGGNREKFGFFVDQAGHCYSLDQAREFVKFMNRWLRGEPGREIPEVTNVEMHPAEECRCRPRTDVNMRTLTLDRARELARQRDRDAGRIRRSAQAIAGREEFSGTAAEVRVGKEFQVWYHTWQQVLLTVEGEIELPGTFLYPVKGPSPAVLHFDDRHRNRELYRAGPMTETVGFCNSEHPAYGVFSVDLRGWGDSAPAMYPYELAGWGGLDRYLSYTSAALGDPVMSMRIRDGLAALEYLRDRIGGKKIILSGSGLGGVVALHVAAIDGKSGGVMTWDALASFLSLLEAEEYIWPAEAFLPNVLLHYDLPELAESLDCPVRVINPKDGTGKVMTREIVSKIYGQRGMVCPDEGTKNGAVVEALRKFLIDS